MRADDPENRFPNGPDPDDEEDGWAIVVTLALLVLMFAVVAKLMLGWS
jgi:hypothetical protein